MSWPALSGPNCMASDRLRTERERASLLYYSGRGSLAGWLRAIISQMAVDRFRKQSKLVQIEETREFENLAEESSNNSNNDRIVSHAENPEEIYSDKQTADDVAEALRHTVASLEPEDRLILKMYYFDDLKLRDIAAVFGYHEATASRKLVRVQNEVRKGVEKALKTKHGWNDGEVKRYLAETAAGLGISFEKMFAVLMLAAILQEIVVRNVLSLGYESPGHRVHRENQHKLRLRVLCGRSRDGTGIRQGDRRSFA